MKTMFNKLLTKIKNGWVRVMYMKNKEGMWSWKLYRPLYFYYLLRNYWPLWLNVFNGSARRRYKKDLPRLDSIQQRIVKEFKTNGIAFTSLDELFPGENLLDKLRDYSNELVEGTRRRVDKPFLVTFWERHPEIDLANPYLAFALNKKIVDIANGYMGMFSKFFMYSLNLTTPMPASARAIGSQNWHRDPEDKKLCKVFIYLNDVDETAGPFIYIKESNFGGRLGNLFPAKVTKGYSMKNPENENLLPKKNIKISTGRAGTVIFCDTAGIHKGGYATGKERLMFTAGFCSQASLWPPKYFVPDGGIRGLDRLDPAVKFALTKW